MNPALREQLAQEAARLISEHGIQDYGQAKRKAAERFGVRAAGALPSNSEIEERLFERQRIFEADEHGRRLSALRRLAAELMDLLSEFRPRLAGPVLTGSATASSSIELHLFTDAPEDVVEALRRYGFPIRNYQRRLRFNGQEAVVVPGYIFSCRGERIYVLTFPEKGLRQAPMSPINGRPMPRAGRGKVLQLLDQA
jgi:hypothetical protein